MSTMRTAGMLGNIQTQDVVGKSRYYIFFLIPQAATASMSRLGVMLRGQIKRSRAGSQWV